MADREHVGWRWTTAGATGVVLVALGGIVCTGWWIESTRLVQIRADLAPMKFNTALGFILLGAALLSWSLRRTIASTVFAALAATMCSLTMAQHITGLDLGLDTLLHSPFTSTLTRHPGRMSHYAGWSFIAMAIIIMTHRRARRHAILLAGGFIVAAAVMLLSCMSLIGYTTGYRLPLSGGTNMALHTALGFMVLSWGVLAVIWPPGAMRRTGLVNALLSVPIAATTFGVIIALALLPEVAGERGRADPVRPLVPALAIVACLTTAALVAARIGFVRAVLLKRANVRLHTEIEHRQRVESAQRLLVSELDHRVRNTLAQVLALAESTARGKTSVEQFHDDFRDRIRALSRAHGVLSRQQSRDVDMGTFLRAVLEPFVAEAGERLTLEGPLLMVPARATTSLCMVFYELATNSAKHGALLKPSGRVILQWSGSDDREPFAEIRWVETGGPAVVVEPHEGFGTSLIRTIVPHELRGTTDLRFGPEGVRCTVRFPIRQPAEAGDTGVTSSGGASRLGDRRACPA